MIIKTKNVIQKPQSSIEHGPLHILARLEIRDRCFENQTYIFKT